MGKKILKTIDTYGIWQFIVLVAMIQVLLSIIAPAFDHTKIGFIHISPETKSALASILSFICLCILYVLFLRSRLYYIKTGRVYRIDRLKYQRSWFELLTYFKDSDPYVMDEESLPYENWQDTDGVILGMTESGRLIKRESSGIGNIACFALPGAGKTTAEIIPTALRFNGGVFALDIKGDIYAATKDIRNIKVFAPDDISISCHFDPLMGIESMNLNERCAYIENMAIALIPDEGDKSKYFVDGGRDFFCGVALYLLCSDINTSFVDIVNAVLTSNYAYWVSKIKNSSCLEAKEYTDAYYGTNEANVAGAYGTAVKRLRPLIAGNLAALLDGKGECITPHDLEGGTDVYIKIPQEKINIYAPVTTMIVQSFLNGFMKRADISSKRPSPPIILLLDEFHQLNFDLDMITTAMATLRSKNVSLFIAQQSIAQLESRYGKAGARQIIDCCAYVTVMSAQDPESREFFSKLIGTRKTLTVGTTNDGDILQKRSNKSVHEAREPIFFPADFGNLGDDVIIYANGKYIRAKKTYYFE